MPISSGALDWPVSYYAKPATQDANFYSDNMDIWSNKNAYQNWTWKTKRSKRKKKLNPEGQAERLRHRRRCCCCVVWWTVCLVAVLLALTLFMVFWIRYRANDVPAIYPWVLEEDYPHCKGDWGKDYVVYEFKFNGTCILKKCCYGRNLNKALGTFINKDCSGGTKDDCDKAYPNDSICGGTQLQAPWAVTLVLVFSSLALY